MNTGLFIPCFIDQLYPDTGFSMLTVLNRAKELSKSQMQFEYNPEQTCCGQLAFNAGFRDEAKHLGEKFIRDFRQYDYVVGPSASCIGMVKNYYTEMFYNSALHNENNYLAKKIFEFSDFLVNVLKIEDLGGHFEAKVTIHDACSAMREYGLKDEPAQLLKNVKGVEIVEMKDKDQCCGFGGTFSIKHEAISTAMAEQKVGHALDTGAQYIVSTEASCLMHLQTFINKQNLDIKTLHLADLLAKSIKNT
jgi:L-lactate dehydrogenase complex protein LldE